ncbi:MAG: hypothetical protein HY912_02890 [Desulfomonile tiedjei]|uniref:Uncharacterized protein n=1 Tax=Desulfomonile tiedjei TaxID=2358 RepID=A0A9D6V0D5_9BACT|nr:hypothetical protein [Desulfomonile tiedjei]
MKTASVKVEQWRDQNAYRLIDCRWGCKITAEACRAYQARTSRYTVHFKGHREQYPRVKGDYLRCFMPEPCQNILSDEEIAEIRLSLPDTRFSGAERRNRANQVRQLNRLVSPNAMLQEAQWHRSLVRI